jgi:hypothetical protein
VAPVTGYVGRYLDSSSTIDFQCCPRTFRARKIRVAPDRDAIYMIVGSTFVRQTLSTFVNRTRTEPMVTLSGAGVTRPQGSTHELYLPFDDWIDPERSNQWSHQAVDGQDRLFDFDFDDRGFTYLAYSVWGLGIVDANLDLVYQLTSATTSPSAAFVFRNGTSYYVAFSDGTATGAMYDVTNVAVSAPVLVRSMPAFSRWAKTAAHVALLTSNGITIHTPATLASAGAALFTLPATSGMVFRDVTTDGTRFYALEGASGAGFIHVLTPSGSTFVDTAVAAPARFNTTLDYGAGYLVVGSPSPARVATIYSAAPGAVQALNELSLGYFTSLNSPASLLPLTRNAETVLLAALNGVGDVFSLAAPPLAIEQQFAPATVLRDAASALTITLTNFNSAAVTSFNLSHTFPADLVNTATPASTTCGGALAATADAHSFALTGASLAASSNCTITLHLASNVAGSFVSDFAVGAIDSAENTNGAPSSATLNVVTGTPESLSATASSDSHVNLTWTAVSGATAYEVYRSSLHSAFALAGTPTVASYSDDGLTPNTTYLYEVRAIVGGSTSDFSAVDPATTTVFTDAALDGIAVKTTHIAELRTAVNAMRAAAGLPAAELTDSTLTAQSTPIKAAHIAELRTALAAARSAIGLTTQPYTDATLIAGITIIKAAHITELRSDTQ